MHNDRIENLFSFIPQNLQNLLLKLSSSKEKINSCLLTKKEQAENIRQLQRKLMQLQTELKRYEDLSQKNSDMFTKLSNQRLKSNKELLDQEIINEELDEKNFELTELIRKGEETLCNMQYYLHDKIYIELVKGMGIESDNEKLKVFNANKKEIYHVKDENIEEIWDLID
ncbi:hypothetical protein GVAV_000789 [Gurleya vavrai]